ncbi:MULTISPECIES: NAD(P)-dependent oxidoreductase [unclassified Sphingobium]|uniref:NAD(P)-dependent oxidoreductase n=1 Tax=unclassified Sphingobium TaxID=2611147 RepID=UPI002FFA36A9
MLTVTKNLPALWIDSAERWQRQWVPMVAGSALGIVGFGDIGRELTSRALAFGMTVSVLRKSTDPLPDGVHRAADLEELLATCDHVVLAAPATEQTRHMINAETLAKAKPGLHLINVARGSLIDNKALLRALDAGKVGHATLDVTDPEPLPKEHRFYTHPRVRLSPHTAAASIDMMNKLAKQFVENVKRFSCGEAPNGLALD